MPVCRRSYTVAWAASKMIQAQVYVYNQYCKLLVPIVCLNLFSLALTNKSSFAENTQEHQMWEEKKNASSLRQGTNMNYITDYKCLRTYRRLRHRISSCSECQSWDICNLINSIQSWKLPYIMSFKWLIFIVQTNSKLIWARTTLFEVICNL